MLIVAQDRLMAMANYLMKIQSKMNTKDNFILSQAYNTNGMNNNILSRRLGEILEQLNYWDSMREKFI